MARDHAAGFDLEAGLEDFSSWFERQTQDFRLSSQAPELLAGGLMNEVWRLRASPHDLVFKWAPPYVASAPSIELSPERLVFEARTLRYVREEPFYARVFGVTFGEPWRFDVPRVRSLDEARAAMLMDFIDGATSLQDNICADEQAMREFYAVWGGVIGRLHAETARATRRARLSGQWRNLAVQRTREQVQYRAVRGWLMTWGRARGWSDDELLELAELSAQIEQLGAQLVALPGTCLVMGDLWPRSVLIDHTRRCATLIDWEFAHFGQPGQDVGHALAHLWMMGHQRGVPDHTRAWLESYEHAVRDAGAPELLADVHQRRSVLHYIAEVLARTLGPFATHEDYVSATPERDEAIMRVISMWRQVCSSPASHPRDCLLAGMW